MVKTVLIILVVTCIISAMASTYKWYALYVKHKKISVKEIITEGKYKPQYINPHESPFDSEQTRVLNRWVVLIYTSMGVGVVFVIMFKFIN